jgi:hypothetical protein
MVGYRIEPLGAITCMRATRLAVCPIGVYSARPAALVKVRTTTSPLLMPTRASSGVPPSATNLPE